MRFEVLEPASVGRVLPDMSAERPIGSGFSWPVFGTGGILVLAFTATVDTGRTSVTFLPASGSPNDLTLRSVRHGGIAVLASTTGVKVLPVADGAPMLPNIRIECDSHIAPGTQLANVAVTFGGVWPKVGAFTASIGPILCRELRSRAAPFGDTLIPAVTAYRVLREVLLQRNFVSVQVASGGVPTAEYIADIATQMVADRMFSPMGSMVQMKDVPDQTLSLSVNVSEECEFTRTIPLVMP